MKTIFHVLNEAKRLSGAKNDSDLARMIGVKQQNLRPWQKGYGLPKDDVMIRLCELAEIDPAEGLLMLNTWRSEGEVKQTYESLLTKLGKSAAALLLGAVIFTIPTPTAEAMVKLSPDSRDLCIMGNKRRRKLIAA